MGRKHKHPEHENLERWLVSYADFITLLFATFTALYAMAKLDENKMKDVSKAIREGFQQQSILNSFQSVVNKQTQSHTKDSLLKGEGQGIMQYESMTYQAGEVHAVNKTVKELQQALKDLNQKIANTAAAAGPKVKDGELPPKGIDVSIQERGLKISFDSSLLFEPGSAALRQDALSDLDRVAERLQKFNNTNTIQVEGHTDDLPIATAVYPSNWELSTARASSVVRYLINHHKYTPSSMVAVGYGASRPLTSNWTAEGRRANRRVDIVIYSQQVAGETDPTYQKASEQTLIDSSTVQPLTKETQLIQEESDSPEEGPVKVIYKQPDGTEKVIIPPVVKPNAKPDLAPHIAPHAGKH